MSPKAFISMTGIALLIVACGKEAENKAPKSPGTRGENQEPARTAVQVGGAGSWQELGKAAAAKGIVALKAAAKDGKWAFAPDRGPDLGVSALAARALLGSMPREEARVVTAPTLDWLLASQKPDGGIYDQQVAVYVTSLAILALREAKDPASAPVLAKAVEYLRVVQTDEGDGREQSSEDYGGIGYGSKGDVNLSTSHFAIEAASAAGLKKDDAFYSKALKFLERCQNRSESNSTVTVTQDGIRVESGNDGGGIYRPGESKAGIQSLPDGRKIFKSYGSMTYALLKSYLFCDLSVKDPRVKAALEWIRANWQLEHNPGMESEQQPEAKYQGLYYYYLTIARTLGALERQGASMTELGLGRWKEDLTRAVVSRQHADGTWVNAQDRWMEGVPALATAYALLVLEETVGRP